MLKKHRFAAGSLAALIGASALVVAPSAHADTDWLNAWRNFYPNSLTDDNAAGTNNQTGCTVCHNTPNGPTLNPYGIGVFLDGIGGAEGINSDNDPGGCTNLEEINNDTQPGWTPDAPPDDPNWITGDLDPDPSLCGAPDIPDISVSPLSVDFGAVTVGTSGADSVAISNVGSADLTIDSLSLSGSSEFSLPAAPATPFTLIPSTSVNVSVEYAPLNEGLDNATLAIASNSPGEELISVALAGTGVPVQVNECVPVVDPASLAFGSVELGNTLALTTTVTNNGTLECQVEAVVSGSGEFGLASASLFTVAPGGSANVDVDYTPADLGDDAGNLTLTFPDRTINVPLSGSGIEAPVEVVDLDIKSFSVTKKIALSRVKPVVIKLTVNNGGVTEGSAPATVTGVQNGSVVHEQTLVVTDAVGNGSTRYALDPFTPDAVGVIDWTMVIADGDPDDDVATATTTVVP